ncbi:Metallo-dependent phosphatase [Hysterangium stoloniferum]|nr:Metallo-dependent phosphatase [Hysterangium stoloniferum]
MLSSRFLASVLLSAALAQGKPPSSHKPTSSQEPTSSSASAATPTQASTTSAFFATPPASLSVPADFTGQPFFQTDFLKAFFPGFGPSQTSVEPQPLITDPVGKNVFPLDLTNPKTIPTANLEDPVVLPPSLLTSSPVVVSPNKNLSTPGSIALRQAAFFEISQILNNTLGSFNSTCSQCVGSLVIAKDLALTAPWEVSPLLIDICNLVQFSAFGSCEQEFSANSDGQIATQLLANADVSGLDGQWMCARNTIPLRKTCPQPAPSDISAVLATWFTKPKPANAKAPPPSGKAPLKVVHLSDFHIDPRYAIGTEANCSDFLCCRPGVSNPDVPVGSFSLPAPRFGAYECDTPWMLSNTIMHAIGPLTGINSKSSTPANTFTIFTGDLTSHDNDNQLSRAYVEYVESAVYSQFKDHLVGPVYAAMGNHDTWPQAFDAPHSIQPGQLSAQFEWNYGHLAKLWETEGWISEQVSKVSQATYSAYSTLTPQGLKIITINTDFWYTGNWFNFINMSNPDVSGMLRFVTDALQAAEDAGQRVWIIGHVLTGWDGTSAFPNGPNLFYQIIERFSPHVIANVFMGHIHDEVRYLYYQNNGTVMNADTALTTTWVGGSVTPLAGLNSGFSMYEVDPETFDVMEAYTWFADVNSFHQLDSQTEVGAAYHFEYSTRDTYGGGFDWPATAPLNATWWHHVSESFLTTPSLVDKWTLNQGRQSALTQNCTSTECQQAKVCYLRSGSPPVAARCTKGHGSVQE